mmetsp:Transcript_115596/g.230436  ORF Transcript_115596/g.230436 Transcript_115596/m.230436 type:complete len:164 (-) Transcript_115596:102-593(-)
MSQGTKASAKLQRWLSAARGQVASAKRALEKNSAAKPVIGSVEKGASSTWNTAKRVHGAIHERFFAGEAPTLYRLRGNKYSHCYGAQKRNDQSMQHVMPYITFGVLGAMLMLFVVFPLSFQRNYSESKKRYEAFARQNSDVTDMLNTQYDRGHFSEKGRREWR